MITAFVGGLPRAQHSEKHTISVLGGVEAHVCFQFGSPIRDFVILPSKLEQPQCTADEESESLMFFEWILSTWQMLKTSLKSLLMSEILFRSLDHESLFVIWIVHLIEYCTTASIMFDADLINKFQRARM